MFDADGGASLHPAERANLGSGALAFENIIGLNRSFLHRAAS